MPPFSNAHRAILCLFLLLSVSLKAMQQRLAIMRTNGAYHVIDNAGLHKVNSYDTDPLLQKMNPLQLKRFFDAGCGIRVNRLDNGDYVLRHHVPGKGGGLFGAGAGVAIGTFIGNVVVFTGIGIATAGASAVGFCVGGPAGAAAVGGVVAKSLTATVVPLAQPFIHSLAIAGGIAGGVATGPI